MDTLLAFDTKTYMPLSNNKQGLIACVWTSTCGLIKWSYQGGGLYFLFIFYFIFSLAAIVLGSYLQISGYMVHFSSSTP